jgi:CheY-like chemotaxis protein
VAAALGEAVPVAGTGRGRTSKPVGQTCWIDRYRAGVDSRNPETSAVNAQTTVLVVDDEPYVRDVLSEYLRARGLEVIEASNGLEALLRFKQVRPSAVVLDLLMPRLGGLRALRRIRNMDEAVRVVVVTAASDPELRRQIEACGVSAVLTKPIKLDDLWTALGGNEEAPPVLPRPPAPAATATDPAPPGRVLVVDDEPEVCGMLERFLSAQGYKARSVRDGASALNAIVEEPPDVVLLDVNMPRLGGIEALTAIHAIAPDVKVIMVSGAGSFDVARAALAHGAFDFVSKPPDLPQLAQTVQAAILMKGLEAEWRDPDSTT